MRQYWFNFTISQKMPMLTDYHDYYGSRNYYHELIDAMKERGFDEIMKRLARRHLMENHPYEIDYMEAARRFDERVDVYYNHAFFEIKDNMRRDIAAQIASEQGISAEDVDLFCDEVEEIFDNNNFQSKAEQIQDQDYYDNKTQYWDAAWEQFEDELKYGPASFVDLILPR